MPRTKSGELISWKEFFKRWKQGIDNITPFQKVKHEVRGTFITLIGFIVSFLAVIYSRDKIGVLSYGLILIFLGSIINTLLRFISLLNQKKLLKDLDEQFKREEEFTKGSMKVE